MSEKPSVGGDFTVVIHERARKNPSFQVILLAWIESMVLAFTKSDRQVSHGFVYLVDFATVYAGQILLAARLKICRLRRTVKS